MTGWRRLFNVFVIFGVCAYGQNSSDPPKKDEDAASTAVSHTVEPTTITVTASRSADEAKNIPQSLNVVSVQDLQRQQPATPNALLREQPGIYSPQVGNQGSPIIRGMIGNRVLYLWDGLRLNTGAIFSGPNGYFNEFPIGAISRMEVVRGPGAVQYGSDAIGGVVNIIPKRHDEGGGRWGGDVYGRYGTGNLEKGTYGDFWGAFSKFDFSMGVTGQNVGNYYAPGLGHIPNTGFATEGGYFDGAYHLTSHQTFRLGWIENRRDDVVAYAQSRLNASGIPRSIVPYEERGIGRISYEMLDAGSWSRELRAYTYFEHFRSPRDVDVESATQFNLTHTVSSQAVAGGGVQNTTAIGKVMVVYGGDYRSEDLYSAKKLFTTTKATNALAVSVPAGNVPPGSYDVFDAFVLARWQASRRLTVTAGGRMESIRMQSNPRPEDALTPFTVQDLTVDKSWHPFTGSVGAVYNVAGNFSLVADIASGFRSPSFSDALNTGVPLFASGIASVPSPNIKPERNVSYEFGGRWASHNLTVTATAYWNQLQDLLVALTTGTINIPGVGVVAARSNVNSGTGYVRGAEIAATYRLNAQWSLVGNFTATRGQDTFRNTPLRFIPPANGLAGLSWTSRGGRVWSELMMTMADRLRRHAPDDELDTGFSKDPALGSPGATNPAYRPGFQIPGYAVANLRVGARVFGEGRRGMDVTFDFNNVLNQRYREAYSQQQILAPGFGLVTGAKWRF